VCYHPRVLGAYKTYQTPHVLTLHLNRSVHYGYYASKNTCQVEFPEVIDLSPFATSGQLSTKPDLPISSPHQSLQPPPSAIQPHHLTLYQLSAVVCHYGQHSFGHYICYRRKPRPVSAGAARFAPPRLCCPLDCRCERCVQFGPIRVGDGYDNKRRPGCGWLRISDDSVQEVGFETVALERSSAFMLFYEKVLQPRTSPAHQQVIRGSEETVRPRDAQSKEPEPVHGGDTPPQTGISGSRTSDVQPRIIRNVSTRRTESPAPQSKPKSPGSQVSTPSLMRGGSYFNAQIQQPQPQANGHVRMPAATSESWYRPASPPPIPRESRPSPSHSSPNSPSKSQSRVPVPPTTAIQYQPQRLQL
jgi:ubiquitin carboxyl-terminal hydrolase 1